MTSHRQRKSQRTEAESKAAFKGHGEDTVGNTWSEAEDQGKVKSHHIDVTHAWFYFPNSFMPLKRRKD